MVLIQYYIANDEEMEYFYHVLLPRTVAHFAVVYKPLQLIHIEMYLNVGITEKQFVFLEDLIHWKRNKMDFRQALHRLILKSIYLLLYIENVHMAFIV